MYNCTRDFKKRKAWTSAIQSTNTHSSKLQVAQGDEYPGAWWENTFEVQSSEFWSSVNSTFRGMPNTRKGGGGGKGVWCCCCCWLAVPLFQKEHITYKKYTTPRKLLLSPSLFWKSVEGIHHREHVKERPNCTSSDQVMFGNKIQLVYGICTRCSRLEASTVGDEACSGTLLARRCGRMTILERVAQCPYVNCPRPGAPKAIPHWESPLQIITIQIQLVCCSVIKQEVLPLEHWLCFATPIRKFGHVKHQQWPQRYRRTKPLVPEHLIDQAECQKKLVMVKLYLGQCRTLWRWCNEE